MSQAAFKKACADHRAALEELASILGLPESVKHLIPGHWERVVVVNESGKEVFSADAIDLGVQQNAAKLSPSDFSKLERFEKLVALLKKAKTSWQAATSQLPDMSPDHQRHARELLHELRTPNKADT